MEDIINRIIKANTVLFGSSCNIKKIDVGFTNTIFDVNNIYIIKICNNINNEDNFKKEINFYLSNKDNNLIPKLYYYNTDKEDVPYYYEVLEKINGVSLYCIWHTLTEKERENVIRQLCLSLKKIHKNTDIKDNWYNIISNKFNKLYKKAISLNLFSNIEKELIDKAYNKFSYYLGIEEFVLLHNDLHFDNIIYDDGKIKLIDFERSVYAPIDFELDIIYRMVRKPWKFANEEMEKYIKLDDYKNIMEYIRKYYHEMFMTNNLYERLAIYDMVYFLNQYIEYPNISELKEDILKAAKIVVGDK